MTTTAKAAAENLLTQHNNFFMADAECFRNPSFENYGKKVNFRNARILAVAKLSHALNRRFETQDEAIEVAQEIVWA